EPREEPDDVADERRQRVLIDAHRTRRFPEPAQVRRDDAVPRLDERRDLTPPHIGGVRKAVQQDHGRTAPLVHHVKLEPTDLHAPGFIPPVQNSPSTASTGHVATNVADNLASPCDVPARACDRPGRGRDNSTRGPEAIFHRYCCVGRAAPGKTGRYRGFAVRQAARPSRAPKLQGKQRRLMTDDHHPSKVGKTTGRRAPIADWYGAGQIYAGLFETVFLPAW